MRGARIIDITRSVAGAYCSRRLGAAGADVIKVEPPSDDPLRQAPPLVPTGQDGRTSTSATVAYLHAYQRGLALDWQSPSRVGESIRRAARPV